MGLITAAALVNSVLAQNILEVDIVNHELTEPETGEETFTIRKMTSQLKQGENWIYLGRFRWGAYHKLLVEHRGWGGNDSATVEFSTIYGSLMKIHRLDQFSIQNKTRFYFKKNAVDVKVYLRVDTGLPSGRAASVQVSHLSGTSHWQPPVAPFDPSTFTDDDLMRADIETGGGVQISAPYNDGVTITRPAFFNNSAVFNGPVQAPSLDIGSLTVDALEVDGAEVLTRSAGGSTADDTSFAGGTQSNATGTHSFAYGDEAQATGQSSFAFGADSEASQLNAIAMSTDSTATRPHAVAIGVQSEATGFGAYALGPGAEASGTWSVALGLYSDAAASNAIAAGSHSDARASDSVSIGSHTQAFAVGSVALGKYNSPLRRDGVPTSPTFAHRLDPIFSVGVGTSEQSRSNALTIYRDGEVVLSRPLGGISMGIFGE